MKALFFTFLFFIWGVSPTDAGQASSNASKMEDPSSSAGIKDRGSQEDRSDDEMPDILTVRDPFLPQLPKTQIMKTAVEADLRTRHNKPDKVEPRPVTEVPKPKESPVVLPVLRVQGIIWGTDKPEAIINDHVVGVGESILKAKVQTIYKDGIDILMDGKRFHVPMDQ